MSAKREYTVADAMLDVLQAHGVSHIFGYPGGAILPFYDALPYHKNITHVLTRHEQGAALMAQGWARTRKEIGVCCATSGPGATNLVTGIADAFMDSIPMLAITGQVPLKMIGKDMFQEVDMQGVTMNITKHNYLVDDPESIVHVMTEAMAIAMSGRPGPVHVDVPKDIQFAPHPREFEIPEINLLKCNPEMKAYRELESAVIDEAITLLKKAKKPMLLIGQGVKLSNAEDLLNKFVEQTGIPCVTTILAKGTVREGTPHYHGYLGMHGFYHSNMAMHEADLILNIGSRFDDRIVGRYDAFGKNATIIHVDIDPSELNKVVTADLAIHADAGKFLQQVLGHTECTTLDVQDWRDQIEHWKQSKPYQTTTDIFSMRNCLASINNEIAKDPERYIVVVDVGQHQMWSMLGCSVADSTKWLCSGGSGTMGFALPTAIGAAFANPNKTVLCITGDGGVQMNIQELGLLHDHNLDVKVMILNNEYLGMVRQWQELFYDHNYSSVSITSPDYCTLAKAYRVPSKRVETNAELKNVHSDIFTSRDPVVVEYCVEKEDNVFPMVPGGKHLGETITE